MSTHPIPTGLPGNRPASKRAALLANLRADPLLRNSGYLALTTATMSLLGFLFWLLNARLFGASRIGEATSLLSATALISYVSLLGFNSMFIRFLPTAEDRNAQINAGLTLCAGAAAVIATGYVLGLPVLAPKLDFVRQNPWYAIGFVVLSVCAAGNLLTDSVFIALRQARYNLLVDGIIQGGTKLGLPLLLVSLGAFGIFASAGIAAGLAVLGSLYFMRRAFGHRLSLVVRMSTFRHVLGFSVASYVSSLFNLFPLLLVPLIVLDRDGAAAAGYYFVAFQLANLLYAVSYAVTESLLAEGSHPETLLRSLARRSALLVGVIAAAGAAVLAAGSHLILLLFGRDYSAHASVVLALLALGAPAVAMNAWASTLLKVTRQLSAMIISNIVYTVVIVGLVWRWVPRGLGPVAVAWLYGNLASGAVAATALFLGWNSHANRTGGRHRAQRRSAPHRTGNPRLSWGITARRLPLPVAYRGLHAQPEFRYSHARMDQPAPGSCHAGRTPALRPLRILLVVNVGFELGGAEKSVRTISEALRRRGHEVRVASTDAKLADKPPFADLIIPQRPRTGITGLLARFWYRVAYRALKEIVADFQPDVVHLHTISEFGPAALRATGTVPTVLTVHGPEEYTLRLLPWGLPPSSYRDSSYLWSDLRLRGRLRYLYLRFVQRPLYVRGFRHVDTVLAPSRFMAAALRSDVGKVPVIHVYNGMALPAERPFAATRNVLFVGRLEAVKGVDVLLRATAVAAGRLPGISLTIVGDGDDRGRLERLTRTLGLENHVHFRGWLTGETISDCHAAAQVVAIPSVWPENLPTVGIEALAAGRPIIGSDVGGIPELVIDRVTGRLVPSGDVRCLADALVDILTDPAAAERMSPACRRHARGFLVEPFIDTIEDLYERLASSA